MTTSLHNPDESLESLRAERDAALCRRNQAERERHRADQEVQWATAAAACTEIAP